MKKNAKRVVFKKHLHDLPISGY
jgi:hypothetical protein